MQHHFPSLFENIPNGKSYFTLEYIQVIAEGELVNRLAIGTVSVFFYNHHLFAKPGF
jgi:hypothetical protein